MTVEIIKMLKLWDFALSLIKPYAVFFRYATYCGISNSGVARAFPGGQHYKRQWYAFPIHCQPWCAFWQKNDMVSSLYC